MDRRRVDTLIEQYGKFSPMSVNEAGALASKIFAKNPVRREEAEDLLEASTLFDETDPGWRHIVSLLVRRHMAQSASQDTADVGAQDWLIATLSTSEATDVLTLDIVQRIMLGANNATEKLGRFGLRSALGCMKAVANDTDSLRVNSA